MWNEIKNKNPQKKKGYELENQSNTGRKEGGRKWYYKTDVIIMSM